MFIIAQTLLACPVIYLRTLSMVYFERPYMSHHLSNLFVVSFDVTYCEKIVLMLRFMLFLLHFVTILMDVNVKHCVN